MVSRTLIQFPFFAPPAPPHNHRPATEVRFSRWNNANAEKFERRRRTQEEIEDRIRIAKRYEAVRIIMSDYNPPPPYPVTETFKSTGTPSAPSKPSIQGKKSKYSRRSRESHPAFKPFVRPREIPNESLDKSSAEAETKAEDDKRAIDIKVGEGGVSYEFPEAPFAYQYSYTETPKLKPSKLREPLVAPFGTNAMPRPWTGRKPHPESKKKLPEFDSFRLPPPHLKGVKPVQSPGPFLPGSGPKYVSSREEILGEPLTKEEVELLIQSCKKSARQHNIGRDGLTHNMLEIIHAHWKRRRVCRIRCKGVCTVDMDNVCEKLEEKTGGKIIYRHGGTIYLFRGRNYNYKTRPRFPLMLWRPVTPVYPRLVKRVPEGLTLEEVTEMRKKGRKLRPILKLSKNGVYHDLAEHVREAFEACDLVRINCEGLNTSDCRKIGAKLKDVVPCVLISFEREHILMWKGRDWVSSLPEDKDKPESGKGSEDDNAASSYPSFDGQAIASMSEVTSLPVTHINPCDLSASTSPLGGEHAEIVRSHGTKDGSEDSYPESSNKAPLDAPVITTLEGISESETPMSYEGDTGENSRTLTEVSEFKTRFDDSVVPENEMGDDVNASESTSLAPLTGYKPQDVSEDTTHNTELVSSSSPWTEGVLLLWKKAIESGSAVLLDDSSFDPDTIYKRSFELARSAPPGPIYRRKPAKESVTSVWMREGNLTKEFWVREESSRKETTVPVTAVPVRQGNSRKITKRERMKAKMKEMKDISEEYLNVVPKGNLAVDELAKLLA